MKKIPISAAPHFPGDDEDDAPPEYPPDPEGDDDPDDDDAKKPRRRPSPKTKRCRPRHNPTIVEKKT